MQRSTSHVSPNIRPWLFTTAIVVVFVWLYLPAMNEFIYDWWHDDNYSHGFLIPVISGYLLWRKRDELRSLERTQAPAGAALVAVGLLLQLLGTAAAEWYAVRFSMIVVMSGLVWYFFGTAMLRATWFPIAFLVFAIPVPYTLYRMATFPLQLFSTQMTHGVLAGAGVPALREGNLIHLSGYSLEVVEACSGLRSMITLSALAALFGYLHEGGRASRLVLFCCAIPIAIIANIFRLLVTVLGAAFVSPQFADGFLHEVSGLLVFMVGLTLLYLCERGLAWIGKR